MGFKNLISFDDEDISTEYSSLMSKVMSNGNERIKFPINEPAAGKKKSQIDEYLDFYGGPGVQHIALATDDIIATVSRLARPRRRVPEVPTTYYDELQGRVGKIDEPIEQLEELGILVDRDDGRLPAADLLEAGGGSPDALLRDHRAQRRAELWERQLQGAVRSDRAGAGAARKLVTQVSSSRQLLSPRAMPIYHTLGEIPKKRHTAFRKPNGGIYAEELMGHEGFTGHVGAALSRASADDGEVRAPHQGNEARGRPGSRRCAIDTFSPRERGAVAARRSIAFRCCSIRTSRCRTSSPTSEDEHFYRNAQADELVYVAKGQGTLESVFGDLPFHEGDYLVIHRGILHRYRFDTTAAGQKRRSCS